MIRSNAEVNEIVEAVRAALYAVPAQRLGQIIINAVYGDPFHVEDEQLVKALREYATAGVR